MEQFAYIQTNKQADRLTTLLSLKLFDELEPNVVYNIISIFMLHNEFRVKSKNDGNPNITI